MTEIRGTLHAEMSSPREDAHLRRPEMTETTGKIVGLGETTLLTGMIHPGKPKEKEFERLSTP